jgi:uncharacterized protein (TIGR03382 family)
VSLEPTFSLVDKCGLSEYPLLERREVTARLRYVDWAGNASELTEAVEVKAPGCSSVGDGPLLAALILLLGLPRRRATALG